MPHVPGRGATLLVIKAQDSLALTQEGLARLVGSSRRTMTRWWSGQSGPSVSQLQVLARAVHPRDPGLAAKLAEEGGATLEALGLARPASPTATLLTPAVAGRPFPPVRLVVDAVVCAAAEAMQAPPGPIRDVLRAAITRARVLGLTLEEMDEALSSPPSPAPESERTKAAPRTKR